MTYKSDSIATVVKRLNNQYFLPAIQRKFAWSDEQIISLFDSIMRCYPISSFLFWELDDNNRSNWEAYKFVENARYGTHNEIANVDGVHDLTLVLDGQQRLTSILIGMKGSYTIKKKYKKRDDPTAWVKQRLYLNLLKDPKTEEEDGESGIHYEFQFFDKTPVNIGDKYWFKVGRILDFDKEDRFYEFRQEEREKLPDSITKGQIAVFERNFERLYRAVWKDDVIAYYTERDQDYDRVLDIFVRANAGGTKLNKSDLLLSMVTSKWSGMNAREEIYNFVERLNNELTRKNYLDKDFLMKSCLVLTDLPVAYKVQNFNNQNLSLIQSKWEAIKIATEKAVDLTNTFGIDRDILTGANALIPISYYFFQHPHNTLRTGSAFDVKNAAAVRNWISMVLVNNVFGGSSDSILTNIRGILKKFKSIDNFPLDEVNKEISRSGRPAYFNEQMMGHFMAIYYSDKIAFLALSLLYDDNNWGIIPYHKDHIFPKSMFSWASMKESGFSREQYEQYLELKDNIGNL